MRLKKLICLGLSVVMVFTAAGCGAATGASSAGEQPAAEEEAGAAEADAAAEDDAKAEEEGASQDTAAAQAGGEAAAAKTEEIAPEDISIIWDDSRVYGSLTLGKYDVITTYGVKGYEDVPFIKASDYLGILEEGKEKIVLENDVMRVFLNGTEAVIDPAADTIMFENPDKFRSSGDIDGAIVIKQEFNVITPSVKNPSKQTEIQPLTVSLKDYNMPVIAYDDDILMPFLALQNTFGAIAQSNLLGYNGKDYYNAYLMSRFAQENAEAKESPYYKAFFSGPFSTKTETTQAYADYGYYSICLLLDLTFGHKEEKNITTFDEYFTRLNAKKSMCSTNPEAAVTAEMMLFFYLFDSGHDGMLAFDTVFGKMDQINKETVDQITDDIKESEEGKELFEEGEPQDTDTPWDVILGALFEKGFNVPEVLPLYVWTAYFGSAKSQDYGHHRLDYAGDTAVIYFDSFIDDIVRDPSYYLDPINEEDNDRSSFAFFYNCFEDIKQHDEVKNVVINICDNGGGHASALINILGFLSKDGEVNMTDLDTLTGSYREERYHVDTNLDGIADDQDGFGGQYDFYIMCSGSSYSCGNALPYFAQQDGLAKIIGTNPGGGDCVVGYFIDAYGRCGCYSSCLKLGRDDGSGFVSDEKATQVDLNMMPSILDIASVPWFDPEGIADAVHRYQNGETEIVYDDRDTGEKLSDFLMQILEKMEQSQGEENSGS